MRVKGTKYPWKTKFNVALRPHATLRTVRDGEPRMAASTFTQLLSSENGRQFWGLGGRQTAEKFQSSKVLRSLQIITVDSKVNMVLNVHRNPKAYERRGELEGGMEVGGEGDYKPIGTLSPPE